MAGGYPGVTLEVGPSPNPDPNPNSDPNLSHNPNLDPDPVPDRDPNPDPNSNPNPDPDPDPDPDPPPHTGQVGTGDGMERVSGGVLRQPAGRLSKTQYNLLVATTTSASLLKDLPPPEGSPRGELTSLATLTPARPITVPQGLRTA